MSRFRTVGFPCTSGVPDVARFTDNSADIGVSVLSAESSPSPTVYLDRDQVRELVTRLTQWLGEPPPIKWTDL